MFRQRPWRTLPPLFCFLLLLILAACGGQGTPEANNLQEVTPTATEFITTIDPETITEETSTPTATPTATPTTEPVKPTLYTTPQKAHITGAANVRTQPNSGGRVLRTTSPNTNVTLYGSVSGEVIWENISTWYLITPPQAQPEYVYAGLVEKGEFKVNLSPGPTLKQGKEIVVTLQKQQLDTYENGKKIKTILITSGKADTPTPIGNYKVGVPESQITMISPWPKGDPNYYAPVKVNYALPFIGRNYYLHDATWRKTFGPTFDYKRYGSHGCVSMSLTDARWLFGWTPQGTLVRIIP